MTKTDFRALIDLFEQNHPSASVTEKNCFAYGLLVGRCDLLDWQEEAKMIMKNLALPTAKEKSAKHIAEQFELDL